MKQAVKKRKANPLNGETTGSKIRTHILLIIASFVAFGPFVWMFLTSIKTYEETIQIPLKFFPDLAQWVNYAIISDKLNFPQLYFNTIAVTVMMIIGQLLIVTICAYAFDRLRFPGKNFLFLCMLALMMVPGQIFIIPRFKLMVAFGLTDTLIGLVLPGLFNVFGVFLMRQFFSTIPRELDEAARIDGCSSLRIFAQIMLPLSKPVLATVVIFSFIWSWNDFWGPLVYLRSTENKTLSLGLQVFQGVYQTDYHYLMAASLVVLLPILVIYVVCQRYFVQGIVMSGMKG